MFDMSVESALKTHQMHLTTFSIEKMSNFGKLIFFPPFYAIIYAVKPDKVLDI